jgi:molybdate transport system substrate-binding protein
MALMLPGETKAADIKVLSTHALQRLVEEVTPEFERSTGHKLSMAYDPALAVKRQIENGTQFDVVLITRGAIDDLTAQGKIAPKSRVNLARSGLGVAVRKGLPKPDIGSVQAFKDALLAAKSVVRSTEGTSGQYFEKLLGQLGIAEQMKRKIVLGPSGRVSELAARGEVDMAVQQISEILPVAGVDFVGPFPAEVQLYTTFAGAVSASSTQADAAKALLAILAGPRAASILRDSGLEPARN